MIADLPNVLVIVFAVVLGLALGSFTTCVVYRIPRGLSIWRNDKNSAAYRSFCPHCQTPLQAKDLVPVLSWVFLKGRCRYCGKAIGSSYVMIEIVVVLLTVLILAGLGFSAIALLLCASIPVIAGIGSFFVLKPRL